MLLEMAVTFAFLTAATMLIAVTLVAALNIHRTTTSTFLSLAARNKLAEQFRADVARARLAPDTLGKQKAGPKCCILRLADDKHIVYRWEPSKLERSEQTGSGTSLQQIPIGTGPISVEFARSGTEKRLITLRLIEVHPYKLPQRFEISAALGGDLK
jgi:hypothetical protein